MKTASWFTALPDDHLMIGISRAVPRRMAPGYRVFRKLAPGPWFNSVGVEEYYQRYRSEILAPLDPREVFDHLTNLAGGRTPVMVCFERPCTHTWCHRAMAAEWFAQTLGCLVPEYGFETLPQHEHPLMPTELRKPIAMPELADVTPFLGRSAMIDGEEHRVLCSDPANPGRAIIATGDRQFSTGIETLRRHFT